MKRFYALLAVVLLVLAAPAAASATAYSTAVLALNPLVFYQMDETSGTTAADSSTHAYTATIQTPTTITMGVPGLDAGGGTAFNFTATTSRMNNGSPNHPSGVTYLFMISAANYSIASYQNVIGLQNASAGIINGHPACSGGATYQSAYGLGAGVPHLVAVESTGFGQSASVDGAPFVAFGSSSQCVTPQSVGGGVTVGGNPSFYWGARNGFQGVIDDVAIIPGALSSAQICTLAILAGYASCNSSSTLFMGSW